MFRPLLRIGGLVAFVTLLSPAAPDAAPPPGLQYDEIVRVIASGTPPPPGSFQSDVAAVQSATPVPDAAPPRRRGFGGLSSIAGAVLSGNASAVGGAVADSALDTAVQNSLSGSFSGLAASLNGFMRPHIYRYAYWNGWERVDDLGAQTATIRKCEIAQVVHLDLAHRTYTIVTPEADVVQPAAAPQSHRVATIAASPAPPGTAVVSLNSTTRALGTQRIEGQPAAAYNATTTFAMTQATGSCRNGSSSFRSIEYVAPIARPPVNVCPVHGRPVPEAPADMVAPSGGCRPTFTAHTSGPTIPPGRLSLYTFMQMNAAASATPAPNASGIGFLTERGNLKTLGPADGAAVFSIPRDFTKSS